MSDIKHHRTHILKLVGLKLRELRKAKGFKSAEQFAFKHEINRVQYGYYEQGKKDLRLSSLLKLLETHNMTISEFFDSIDQQLNNSSKSDFKD